MNRSFSPLIFIHLLFGGIFNIMGYLFLLFGLVFVWAFDIPATIEGFINFQGELSEVEGEVTEVLDTNMYENDYMVYEIHFKYNERNGNGYKNFSFGTSAPSIGQKVMVEYNVDNPYYSRIQDYRFSEAPIWVSFVLIFPLIGLLMVMFGLSKGLFASRLVRVGELAEGTLKSKTVTPVRINNQPVYSMAFEFRARDGQMYQAISKTHLPHKLEDDAKEKIFYDPKRPGKAVLLDAVPVELTLQGNTYIFKTSGGKLVTLLHMILPAASILVIYNLIF